MYYGKIKIKKYLFLNNSFFYSFFFKYLDFCYNTFTAQWKKSNILGTQKHIFSNEEL